jgi:putative Holliday junction resolvase
MPDAAVLLGFDYGEKRIGVAIANTLTRSASPLGIIENRNRLYRFEEIGKLIVAWQPTQLVVGLPLHPDGAPHEMTQLAQRFGNQLNGRFNLPVAWADERYSSVEARAIHASAVGRKSGTKTGAGSGNKHRPAIDDEAARLILQQYLDDYVHA